MTEPNLMPDSERIVLDALRTVLPEHRCAVYLPTDWQLSLRKTGRLVIARRVGGVMKDKRYVDEGMFTVQTYATSHAGASLLARRVRAGLVRLAFEQWGNATAALDEMPVRATVVALNQSTPLGSVTPVFDLAVGLQPSA
ncbi:hypothetical protein ACFZDG_03095 [Kitasatospora xanthocidica]|uniref:hypothetical protein n=1 Tax=Kitasatospora xanthocidica TaxID=83382 RepID=UPI0036E5AD5C